MYVFIKVVSPDYNTESLYTYDVSGSWTLVEENCGTKVYAYGVDKMTILSPVESIEVLTTKMTMLSIQHMTT